MLSMQMLSSWQGSGAKASSKGSIAVSEVNGHVDFDGGWFSGKRVFGFGSLMPFVYARRQHVNDNRVSALGKFDIVFVTLRHPI